MKLRLTPYPAYRNPISLECSKNDRLWVSASNSLHFGMKTNKGIPPLLGLITTTISKVFNPSTSPITNPVDPIVQQIIKLSENSWNTAFSSNQQQWAPSVVRALELLRFQQFSADYHPQLAKAYCDGAIAAMKLAENSDSSMLETYYKQALILYQTAQGLDHKAARINLKNRLIEIRKTDKCFARQLTMLLKPVKLSLALSERALEQLLFGEDRMAKGYFKLAIELSSGKLKIQKSAYRDIYMENMTFLSLYFGSLSYPDSMKNYKMVIQPFTGVMKRLRLLVKDLQQQNKPLNPDILAKFNLTT